MIIFVFLILICLTIVNICIICKLSDLHDDVLDLKGDFVRYKKKGFKCAKKH